MATIIVVICLVIGLKSEEFLSYPSLISLLRAGMVMGIYALCAAVVMISGGIDVSFPVVAGISSYTTLKILLAYDNLSSVFAAFLISAIIGMLLGLINAILIHEFNIPTLIATIGTSSLYVGGLGVILGILNDISNLPTALETLNKKTLLVAKFEKGNISALPMTFLIFVALAIITYLILKYTYLGRGIYSLGCSKKSAIRAGYNIRRINYFIYTYVGFMAGIAGMMHATNVRSCSINGFLGIELTIIAAVAFGGISITGGRGTILGALIGIAMFVIINNSFILLGIPPKWQAFFFGLIILIGVGVSSYRYKLSQKT